MGRPHYGIVGNGITAALVAPDGTVAWFCLPRFDGSFLFAAGLDPLRGGGWRLVREDGELLPAGQAYIEDTNVLVTRLRGSDGLELELTDWMPWQEPCLVRRLRVRNAAPSSLRVQLAAPATPVTSRWFPWQIRPAGAVLRVAGPAQAAVAVPDPRTVPSVRLVVGPTRLPTLVLDPGEVVELRLALAYGTRWADAEAGWRRAAGEDPEAAVAFWRTWLDRAHRPPTEDPALAALYRRSLLVLKLLTHEPTGALVASPTASWPAVPGGSENWDYRYCWVRDACYAAEAFDRAGLHAEARRLYEFLRSVQERDGSWPRPVYTLSRHAPDEHVIYDLAAPGGELPVRIGNAAWNQLQLDAAGSILHGLWRHVQLTGDRPYLQQWWPHVRRAARWVSRNWHRPEHGIWEVRERADEWVHGKTMCAVALDRAARIAEALGEARRAQRWRYKAAWVREQVLSRGWREDRRAFVRHYGEDAPLDVSVLALALYDVLPADDLRLADTAACLERPAGPGACVRGDGAGLNLWGGIGRFEGAELPFYLPTMWLARYHARAGSVARAEELIRFCAGCASDLGLMGEHFDPRTGAQWGNFPQAFSHEELVQALWDLRECGGVDSGALRAAASGIA